MKFSALALCAIALTSCSFGGGTGDEKDLSEALSRGETFTVAESDCIAAKVFCEYGDDDDALAAISNADDIEELASGEDTVEDFAEKFADFQEECSGATAEESD